MRKLDCRKVRRRIAVIVGVLLLGVGGCDVLDSRTDGDYVARALELRDEGNPNGAIIELKNALQKNPENAKARSLLGQAYVERGDGAAAEKELRRAIELHGARKADLRLPLAEALSLQGKNQELLIEIVPDAPLPPRQRAMLTAWRGDAWLGMRKPDLARREYEEALAIDAQAPLAKLGLARLAAGGNRIAEAQRLVSETLAADPKEPSLWSFQASLWESANELGKAEAAYTRAMALRRFNVGDRASRALVRINLERYRDARQDILTLKKEAPAYYLTHYADGLLDLREGKYPEAQAAFEASERLNSGFPLLHYQLGLVHLGQNHLVQAEQYLSRFLQAAPKSLGGVELLAVAKFRQRDFKSVKSLLAPVLEARPDDILALRLMGEAEIALGNLPQGIEYLRKWVELDPKSAEARHGLGLSLLASGEIRKGLAAFEAAAELSPEAAQPDILIALAYVRARDFGKAIETIGRVREKSPPDSEVADNLLGLVRLAQHDSGGARQAFGRALGKRPGDPAISHQLARLAVKEHRLDEARRLYEDVLKVHREDLPTAIRLAQLDALEGRFKQMAERMEAAVRVHPEALHPRLILAEYLLRQGQPDRAQAMLAPLQAGYPRHPKLLALVVQAQLDTGQARPALDTAKALADAAPRSAKAHYLLALAYAGNRETRNMRNALERALAVDAGFTPAQRAMVKVLALEKKYPEAEAELAKLLRANPDDVDVLGLQGWFATIREQPAEAVRAYRKALEKAPDTRTAIKLARAQWQAGDRTGAVESLEAWTRAHPEDSFSRYLLAGLYRETGRTEDARTQLEEVLRINPNNVPAMNDLAWLIRRTDPGRALTLAERATRAAPQSPALLDTRATILMDQGHYPPALDLLRRAVALDPRNQSMGYRLALALNKTGKIEDALKIVRTLLADGRPFPERKDAQELLKEMSGHAGG
jgi:putative PEP-CTERM system TPR-repeat lipoprotein